MTTTSETSDRARTREVLHAALDLPVEDRRAYVEQHLPAGETLEDALSLLSEVDGLGDFLTERPSLAARPFEPALPERVGSYRIERLLGWGSMGVVYLATQDAPQRPVAVKMLRVDASSPTLARRFQQEGSVLAMLSHPGIASVYESGFADLEGRQQPFFAMEFVDGVSLTRHCEREELDRRQRVELVVRTARAVSHAHAQGVLHRDLKPENILVKPDGRPVVLDFGVAHATGEDADRLTLTATGQVVGTLSYMAPEQARGLELDARADQFALGAILYELLTDDLPFDIRGRLPHETLRIVAEGACALPTKHDPSLAGDLEAILMTVLASEPVRRYPDVEAFADDLQRWLDGDPVLARPPSRFAGLARFVRRNRALSVLVMLVLLTVGAGLSWGAGALLDLRREGAVAQLFSDLRLHEQLELEARELWPVSSATLPAFDDWLRLADQLVARLPEHESLIRSIEARDARAAPASQLAAGWLVQEGALFVEQLSAFAAGRLVEVRERRASAAEMFSATVGRRHDDWQRVAERVAADPRFDGLRLPPQEGLVPLGPDPASGLEEFALWASGSQPVRGPDGRFAPRAEDALVFVLVPGGDVLIGAQSQDPEGANYTRKVSQHEGPPIALRLDPFLISKFEMTQAQWVRAFRTNPSDWEVGSVIADERISELHPVESFSWQQGLELLAQLGLTFPTEAQWERGAMADSRWPCLDGPSWTALIGHANWNTHDSRLDLERLGLEDDGYVSHMPIGSFAPNAYGLHDTVGNVWEFCLDVYKVAYHALEHRAGDGLVLAEPDGDVSRRGGGPVTLPYNARVTIRSDKRVSGRDAITGVRPARALVLDTQN